MRLGFVSVPGYLHQVRSYGRGISYTVQFAPSVLFKASECNKDEPKGTDDQKKRRKKARKGKTEDKSESKETTEDSDNKDDNKEVEPLNLADVKFVWAYTHGERVCLSPLSLSLSLSISLSLSLSLINQTQHFDRTD